jgi:hypothetical protein
LVTPSKRTRGWAAGSFQGANEARAAPMLSRRATYCPVCTRV